LSTQVIEEAIELAAFARLMRAHTVLRRELETEVLAPRGLTQSDFEALLHLSRAPELRLRRVDLVQLLMLTPSGVTRLLDGLQESGLVENVQCDDDARVTWARLTQEGIETVDCVGASHAQRLQSLFGDAMTQGEVGQLAELLGRLPGVGAVSCSAALDRS
jgi:DNA-binding MarR family transcriptional regulator